MGDRAWLKGGIVVIVSVVIIAALTVAAFVFTAWPQ